MKHSEPREGDVVRIPLGGGRYAYGRLLVEPLVEYFDREYKDADIADLEEIVATPAAFGVDTMRSKPDWEIVGHAPLTEDERREVVRFFKQDPLTGELSIYWEDPTSGEVHETPATLEECEGLERAAVWSPEHVEDRLRDHFAGQPSLWVELLRPNREG